MGKSFLEISIRPTKETQQTLNSLNDLTVKGKRRVFVRAINKTMMGLRTDIVRTVRGRYNIKAKEIRSRISIYRAAPWTLMGKLTVCRGRRMGLAHFAPRPSKPVTAGGRRPKKGVSVQILKGKPRKILRGSFLQEGKHGLILMKRAAKERDSARIKYGPSFMSVLEMAGSKAELQAETDARFVKNLEHEFRFLKNKERGGK